MLTEIKTRSNTTSNLTATQQLRYSAQLLLSEMSEQQQRGLANKRVLIIGLGGLGCISASYLAGAGVGELVLADADQVSLSNLHRQLLYTTAEVGQLKVAAAKARLLAQNPDVRVSCLSQYLTTVELTALLPQVDLVLDCTDNASSRLAINHACFKQQITLVTAAASCWQGQVLALQAWQGGGCYQCLFPDFPDIKRCLTAGVMGPVVGLVASQQALLALKILLGIGDSPFGQLLCFDGLISQFSQIQLQQDPACAICGSHCRPNVLGE